MIRRSDAVSTADNNVVSILCCEVKTLIFIAFSVIPLPADSDAHSAHKIVPKGIDDCSEKLLFLVLEK